MVGGYLTLRGIDGKARCRDTRVEEALPVTLAVVGDRCETPEDVAPEVASDHPIVAGLPVR